MILKAMNAILSLRELKCDHKSQRYCRNKYNIKCSKYKQICVNVVQPRTRNWGGPASEKGRRPYRSRLRRGTVSSSRSADRRARRGAARHLWRSAGRRARLVTYGVSSETRYVDVRSRRARNTRTSSLYSTRHFTGSQWGCFSAAVMLDRSLGVVWYAYFDVRVRDIGVSSADTQHSAVT